jgi:micrococcal nuclease
LAPDLEISPAIPTTDGPEETSAPTATNEATSTPAPTVTVIKETGLETALVVQVLDGDTVDVMIDGANYRLRYIGIDSPEDGQPF